MRGIGGHANKRRVLGVGCPPFGMRAQGRWAGQGRVGWCM